MISRSLTLTFQFPGTQTRCPALDSHAFLQLLKLEVLRFRHFEAFFHRSKRAEQQRQIVILTSWRSGNDSSSVPVVLIT